MAVLNDARLFDAGLLSDMVLGFRCAVSGRLAKGADQVQAPEHLHEERNRRRLTEFRHGARIGLAWRSMRIGMGVRRRENRNRQFREEGIALVIDRSETRDEALRLLHEAIAQVDGFPGHQATLVAAIVESLDPGRERWDMGAAVVFYGDDGPSGILSPMSRTTLKAMGEGGWTSVEAMFQAQKFPYDINLQDRIRMADTPALAKAIATANRSSRRRDWPRHRTTAMTRAIAARARQDDSYRSFLLSTDGCDLVEDTSMGDHHPFWGVVDGCGANMAGQIAMAVRTALIDGRLTTAA